MNIIELYGCEKNPLTINNWRVGNLPISFNPLRAKLYWGNINIYLHFMSLLHINMTQVVKILPLSKTRTYIFYLVNIMAADVLAT